MAIKKIFKKSVSALLSLGLIMTVFFSFSGLTGGFNVSAEDVEDLDKNAVAGADNVIVTRPAKQITVKGGNIITLELGRTLKTEYALKPRNSDDVITFKSFNQRIAAVTAEGEIKAVGVGETIIQLKATSGEKARIYITVEAGEAVDEPSQEAQSLEIVSSPAMLRKGKTFKIETIIYPLGAEDTLTYKSSDNAVAAVSSTGTLTGRGDGDAVITVSASNGVFAEFSVMVYSGVLRGIDVSKWQEEIDWKKVGESGVDFAMIRSSFGSGDIDVRLSENVAGCEKYGIPYGFYHYTYARTVEDAAAEAEWLLRAISGYNPRYPVVVDIEADFFKSMSKVKVTNIIITFINAIRRGGYTPMIYSYAKFFNYVDMERIKNIDIWVACWGDDEEYLNSLFAYPRAMWQYSSEGSVSGINGFVDLDYSYKDYSVIVN